MTKFLLPIVLLVWLLLFPALGWADLKQGLIALYHTFDYATALKELRPLAEQGDFRAQFNLGFMYEEGRGVPKDKDEAMKWYSRAAEQLPSLAQQGDAEAQYLLGRRYGGGRGVPKDKDEAMKWFRLAAEQGHPSATFSLRFMAQDDGEALKWTHLAAELGDITAQFVLGTMYASGRKVPKDYVLAYKWWNLAAAQGDENSALLRDKFSGSMTSKQIGEAQKLTRQWKPKTGSAPIHRPDTEETKPVASGSGFVISRQGHILTNYHVIEECKTIRAPVEGAENLLTVIGTDAKNDLAVLTLPIPFPNVAYFRAGRTIRPGDEVMVVGFPLHGLLASEAQVTTGAVSALAGIGNDTRFLQITAPVQPGNSGGPLLDQGGHVVGLVVSKLNAMHIAKTTGDIPQNINFAIKGTVAKSFLDSLGVEYETGSSTEALAFADVGAAAKKFTLLLECYR